MKQMRKVLFGFLIASLFAGAAAPRGCGDTSPDPPEKIDIYMTNMACDVFGMQTKLIQLLDSAQDTIDAHFYNCGRQDIANAFIEAEERGVRVRFITDYDNYQNGYMQDVCYGPMEAAGIPIITEAFTTKNPNTAAESHNKFVVVDGRYVWTGSLNLTDSSMRDQANDVVVLESSGLAEAYTDEFEKMWGSSTAVPNASQSRFGVFKSPTMRKIHTVGGETVEVCFDAEDPCEDVIIEAIQGARDSIDFAIFTFTRQSIASALIDAANRGVHVRGIFDAEGASFSGSQYDRLESASGFHLSVKKGNEIACPVEIHSKLIIIDAYTNGDPIVITGSKNWTSASETINDE
ncbi:MAG: phosphatidylserine/phosphatidylglycerophosphate/cardiolipin synthase family protein, partial [Deltaproteobacteria bacterium]